MLMIMMIILRLGRADKIRRGYQMRWDAMTVTIMMDDDITDDDNDDNDDDNDDPNGKDSIDDEIMIIVMMIIVFSGSFHRIGSKFDFNMILIESEYYFRWNLV